MIVIYSNDHEAAPLLEDPLEEHNVDRRMRPILKKVRKVRGKTGWLLRRYGYIFGAPKGDAVGLGHHALQIGPHVYEMTREKGLVGQRLMGEQIWQSTVGEIVVGYTDMSDEDIQIEALKAQTCSRNRNGGKYHIKHNNCQHFIGDLERRIVKFAVDPTASTGGCDAHGIVTYSPESPSHTLDRHDSFMEKSEMALKVRESTFGPLIAAAMEAYGARDAKGGPAVSVITTELVAVA